jgi:hypothetical protein
MTPSQIAVKAVDLARVLRTLSTEPEDAIAILLGALGYTTGSVEGVTSDDAWNALTDDDHKALFKVYFDHARGVQP